MKALHINGNTLTLEEVREAVYEHRPVLLDPDARTAVDRARALIEDANKLHVEDRIANGEPIYQEHGTTKVRVAV